MTHCLPNADFIVKLGNFPPGACVFEDPGDEAAWNRLRPGTVLKNTVEDKGYRVNPVNRPDSFFIAEEHFTTDYFAPVQQPVEYSQAAYERR